MLLNRKRRFRGQGLVEFALVSPIFFLMVLGIIEGGRLVWTYHTLNNAVKEGSRYALVRGTNSDLDGAPVTWEGIKDHMIEKSTGLNESNLSGSLFLEDGDKENMSAFEVRASYEHEFIVSFVFGMGTLDLEASSRAIFAK